MVCLQGIEISWMETNPIKISTVIRSILGVAVIEIIARLVIDHNLVDPLIGLGLARLAAIMVLLTLVKISEKDYLTIGLNPSNVSSGLKKGFIWAVIFGIASGVILCGIYLLGVNVPGFFRGQLPAETRNIYAFFIIGTFFGPLAEEIFFRGILYGFLRRWGMVTAIVLSKLLFVLSHTSGPALPITQIIGGILFAVSYEVEKNLLVPITIHCLGNLAIFTLAAFI